MIIRIFVFALLCLLILPAQAQGLINNHDFETETGSWSDGEGPPGWSLNLGDSDQRGIVAAHGFVEEGENAFHFNRVARGFGDSRLEQCLNLNETSAIQLSAWVRTDEPHPELATRLRMDFYADDACQDDSANAGSEQIQSDISLSADRVPAGQWTQLRSEVRLGSELGDDVGSVRISLRLRDRSDDGQPRDPVRVVWFDRIDVSADIALLPAAERDALRDLYQATDGEQWTSDLQWMGAEGTECRWQGVVCNADGDRVERISLPRNRLLGELPASLADLSALIPGEGLDLCWNELLVPAQLQAFVDQYHVGGDPAHCQGLDLLPVGPNLSGSYFQPADRYGEGFMLHMLSAGSALLMWANYDDQGEPIWLIASGRAHDRVLQFEDVYHTHSLGEEIIIERVGRASLAFIADEQRPDCSSAVMRFHVEGDGFGAGDGRQLSYLDGLSDCAEGPEILPVLRELEGHWFDTDQSGQGLSFMPIAGNGLWLNWFGYDGAGEQIWQAGAGWPDPDGEVISFEPLYSVYGGNFNDFMGPEQLGFQFHQSAELRKVGDQWQFSSSWQGEELLLELHPIEAGPDLLASTGHRIDLIMDSADLDELYSRDIFSDDRLPGTVRFDGQDELHSLTGLRFRGSSGRRMPKKSFNIRFENDQSLLFGSDRMNLNAMYTDPSMMRETLSFEIFRELGHPASSTRHFDLWINGNFEGTYTHIQRVDEQLLDMHDLNPDGTLVRDDVRGNPDLNANSVFGLDLSGLDQQQRIDLIAANFNERGEPDWYALLDLIEWVQDTPAGADFQAGFEERFDVDVFIDWLAIHWLIGDIDSFGDDYWLYLDSGEPGSRWIIIPWDKDLSFGSHWRGSGFDVANDWFAYEYPLTVAQQPGNTLITRFLATPALRQAAESRLLELIDQQFTGEWFHARIEALAERLTDSASIPPGPDSFKLHPGNHHSTRERYQEHVETLTEFVELRQAFLHRQIEGSAGTIDQASALIPAGSSEAVLLTDLSGATLARIRPLTAVDQDTSIQISVMEAADLRGIDRRWALSVDSDLPDVELTLYYRNEISTAWGRGNWWTEGDEPIGRQDELQLFFSGPGDPAMPATRVNPYANLASAILSLDAGNHEVSLELPD